jgi:hypothetical protein
MYTTEEIETAAYETAFIREEITMFIMSLKEEKVTLAKELKLVTDRIQNLKWKLTMVRVPSKRIVHQEPLDVQELRLKQITARQLEIDAEIKEYQNTLDLTH